MPRSPHFGSGSSEHLRSETCACSPPNRALPGSRRLESDCRRARSRARSLPTCTFADCGSGASSAIGVSSRSSPSSTIRRAPRDHGRDEERYGRKAVLKHEWTGPSELPSVVATPCHLYVCADLPTRRPLIWTVVNWPGVICDVERRRQVQRWLAIRKRDGLTYRELSQRVGVSANALAQWAWRLRRDAARSPRAAPEFVELVACATPQATPSSRVEIVARNDRRLIVDTDIDVDTLTQILIAIERC